MKVGCFSSLLLGTVYLPPLPNYRELATASTAISKKAFVGYFQSWSDKTVNRPEQLQLANIAPYVHVVIVSFMKPDASYNKGSYDLTGTGLQFTAPGKVVKDAIILLKRRNPKTKVLLAVGGLTYTNFAQLNSTAIANVVKDFGFDGVDIDYEPTNAQCSILNGKVSCTSDAEFRRVVSQIRHALPKPYLLTVAAWSIGAYGEGQWANAQPQGTKTGFMINLLRSREGATIDQLHIMSYDAGQAYKPQEALAAYLNYFQGKVFMGVEVPPEAWGGNVYTLPKVRNLAQTVIDKNAAGLMLWSLQKQPDGVPSDNNPNAEMITKTACHPNAEMITKTACQTLVLFNCQQPLFSSSPMKHQ